MEFRLESGIRPACDCGLLESDPYLCAGDRSPLLFEMDEEELPVARPVDEKEGKRVLLLSFALESTLLLVESGKPSHLLLVLGTWSGNFCDETPDITEVLLPFCAAIFFCASTYSSHADCEGSLRARNPRTDPFFFLPFPRST